MRQSKAIYSTWAWAIDTQSPGGHGCVGIYWWFAGEAFPPVTFIPPQCKGCSAALFITRQEAIQHLAEVRKAFRHAKVIKVNVVLKKQLRRMEKPVARLQEEIVYLTKEVQKVERQVARLREADK